MLSCTVRPSLTALTIEARGLGPLDAHGGANIGLLERGRVVHAVAGHGDDMTVGLQRPHDAQLVLGAGAREHGHMLNELPQRVV
jgi:hypothetical protein